MLDEEPLCVGEVHDRDGDNTGELKDIYVEKSDLKIETQSVEVYRMNHGLYHLASNMWVFLLMFSTMHLYSECILSAGVECVFG